MLIRIFETEEDQLPTIEWTVVGINLTYYPRLKQRLNSQRFPVNDVREILRELESSDAPDPPDSEKGAIPVDKGFPPWPRMTYNRRLDWSPETMTAMPPSMWLDAVLRSVQALYPRAFVQLDPIDASTAPSIEASRGNELHAD